MQPIDSVEAFRDEVIQLSSDLMDLAHDAHEQAMDLRRLRTRATLRLINPFPKLGYEELFHARALALRESAEESDQWIIW